MSNSGIVFGVTVGEPALVVWNQGPAVIAGIGVSLVMLYTRTVSGTRVFAVLRNELPVRRGISPGRARALAWR
mgnify:CR=1 FL=1